MLPVTFLERQHGIRVRHDDPSCWRGHPDKQPLDHTLAAQIRDDGGSCAMDVFISVGYMLRFIIDVSS